MAKQGGKGKYSRVVDIGLAFSFLNKKGLIMAKLIYDNKIKAMHLT